MRSKTICETQPTNFTAGMVNRQIVIAGVWYTILSVTDATHIALTTTYQGTTNPTATFAVKQGWNDLFQDFTTSVSPSGTFCPMDTYEDVILVGQLKDSPRC